MKSLERRRTPWLTKKDLYFTVLIFSLIVFAITVLATDPDKPPFETNFYHKSFLPTLSLAVLSGLIFATAYAYFTVRNSTFWFMSLCWLANLIYIICGMVEATEKQKYVTFVVALTADVPLFLSAFSEQQRRWWFPLLPIAVIGFSCVFYGSSTLDAEKRLGVLYIIGPLSSAFILLWTGYALWFRQVLDPSIKFNRAYGVTFLLLALFQLPFAFRGVCGFYPTLLGCGRADAVLIGSKTAILVFKIANLTVLFSIIRDRLTGLYNRQQSVEQQLRVKGEFEELGYFAASLEHELRNPLEVLDDEIEVLKKRTQSDDELQQHFAILQQQMNRISVAADIINVLRSKREDIIRKMKPFSLVANVNQAVKDVKKELPTETSNVFFSVFDRTNQASIEAVPQLVEQCIVNVFKNSLEAIKRVGRTGEVNVELTLQHRDFVVMTIQDNGDGFIDSDIEILTDPGYTKKAKSTTKSNRGLGLFVCKRIVNLHEGDIWFLNGETGGAVVKIRFARYVSKRMQKNIHKSA